MKRLVRFVFLFTLLIAVSSGALAQKSSGKKKGIKPQDVEKIKAQQKKSYNKSRDKELKHRFEIQDKQTQARIKKSRKETRKKDRQERGPFYKNWFKKKPEGKVKVKKKKSRKTKRKK